MVVRTRSNVTRHAHGLKFFPLLLSTPEGDTSAQCKVLPRDSSLSFGSSRHLGLSIKHDSWDNVLIDKRATKQFAFCHSWFALCTVINYLQCWSCYMQHHNSNPPPPPGHWWCRQPTGRQDKLLRGTPVSMERAVTLTDTWPAPAATLCLYMTVPHQDTSRKALPNPLPDLLYKFLADKEWKASTRTPWRASYVSTL